MVWVVEWVVVDAAVVASWQGGLDDLFARFAGRFFRVEPRRLAFAYVRGLLAPLERRNGWTLAEEAGLRSPNAIQDMLYSPCWDPDEVRDDVRGFLMDHLAEPGGVLIADETGFREEGRAVGRGAAPVLRYRGPDRELPARGVSGLRQFEGPGVDRSGVVPTRLVDG